MSLLISLGKRRKYLPQFFSITKGQFISEFSKIATKNGQIKEIKTHNYAN